MKSVRAQFLGVAFSLVAAVAMAGPKGGMKSEVEKNFITVDFDPVFVKKDGRVMINLLNLEQGKVTFKVYDSTNRLVYIESVDGDLVVVKSFNFEQAVEDKYTVVGKDAEGTYSETITVR